MADAIDNLREAAMRARAMWLDDEIEEIKDALGQMVSRSLRDSLNQDLRVCQQARRELRWVVDG